MQIVRRAGPGEGHDELASPQVSTRGPALFVYAGLALLIFVLAGTWLVWFAQYLDHRMMTGDIHGACARIMPENKERCADTVIIQRGGARR
jgi:hypothetical protein